MRRAIPIFLLAFPLKNVRIMDEQQSVNYVITIWFLSRGVKVWVTTTFTLAPSNGNIQAFLENIGSHPFDVFQRLRRNLLLLNTPLLVPEWNLSCERHPGGAEKTHHISVENKKWKCPFREPRRATASSILSFVAAMPLDPRLVAGTRTNISSWSTFTI